MHIRRFFVNRDDILSVGQVSITGQDAVHIRESLRLKAGDAILVLDGSGKEYDVTLEEVSRGAVKGKVVAGRECKQDMKVQIALYQALPKGAEKVNFVLRRGTEIGLSEIGFFSSARSVPMIRGPKRSEEKLTRWRRVVTEAAKQCRRATLPEVALFEGLEEVLAHCENHDLVVMAWEDEEGTRLREVLKGAGDAERVALIVGPEGGFEKEEVRLAEDHGAKVCSLGKLILRSELAGIVGASLILYEFGELG
jgi:16S rRNA (uracil1498-N3)-methyltransferase